MRYLWVVILAIIVIGLAIYFVSKGSYGSSNMSTTTSSSTPVAVNSVSMENFTFVPSSIQIPVGTTVTFTNNDSTTHRPISDSGAFDLGQLAPGKSATHTFDQSGSFPYHCSIHPSMTGMIIVQ